MNLTYYCLTIIHLYTSLKLLLSFYMMKTGENRKWKGSSEEQLHSRIMCKGKEFE